MYNYFKIDENLINFKKCSLSISKTSFSKKSLDLIGINDIDGFIEDRIKNEFDVFLSKEIINKLLESEDIDLIDLINISKSEIISKNIKYFIDNNEINKKYKNIITSGKIISFISDLDSYVRMDNLYNLYNYPINLMGTYYGMNIYSYNYFNWNFDRICFCNDININIKDTYKESYENNINYYFNYDFHIEDTKVLYVAFDEESESYKEYILRTIPKNRENKIKKILNE
jgi:hypothetical protein